MVAIIITAIVVACFYSAIVLCTYTDVTSEEDIYNQN